MVVGALSTTTCRLVPVPCVTVTEPLTGCVTPEPSTGTRPETSAGVFVSMLDSDELPVVCRAEVAAPVGSGRVAALTG